jgi:hypothetical protein
VPFARFLLDNNITMVGTINERRKGIPVELKVHIYSSKQCCGSGSESERIRAFLAGTESESEIFVPDSDSDPNSDPVPDPVI